MTSIAGESGAQANPSVRQAMQAGTYSTGHSRLNTHMPAEFPAKELKMEISQTKVVPVNAKELRIHLKISDRFGANIHDESGKCLGGQDDGYVPDFMPGNHYGDYVILNIDLDTGMVTNWKTPTREQVEKFIGGEDEED